MNTQETIKEQVTTHPVVLYMKGTPQAPQCGFSAHAVKVLNACGVNDIYAVDVLAEPEIRQVVDSGYHEKSKDEFKVEWKAWNYALRGRTIDRRELRVAVKEAIAGRPDARSGGARLT